MFLLLVALAAAIFLAVGRARIERTNRAVEIIVDADDVRQLATAAGLPISRVLSQLRGAGASALAVREVTVEELIARGDLLPVAVPGGTSLVCPDPELLTPIAAGIQAKLPRALVGLMRPPSPAMAIPGMTLDQLAPVPVFLRPDDLREARAAGLRVVGRLMNFAAASPQAIEASAAAAKAAGARLIVFREDQVLGFQELVGQTADAFARHDLLYGYVEMTAQKGDDALARRLVDRLVRVHSITDADMQTIAAGSAVARFERAVVERNVRACYVRSLLRPQPDPMTANTRLVADVAGALRARGFRIGPPAAFAAPEGWPPRWARALVLLALPAAFMLLLLRLVPLREGWAWAVFVLLLMLGAAVGLRRPTLLAPLGGLAAACLFPALAVVWAIQWSRRLEIGLSTGRLLGRALVALLVASAATLVGAMVVVGLFSPVGYLSGVGRFVGVKLSYIAPLFIILAVVICDLPGRAEPLGQWWTRARLQAARFFGQPVTMIVAALLLVALGALAFAVSRSGNQPAVAPTGLELKLRNLLESWLVVRPRTKEFLLGHPALMLAVALSLRGRRAWLPLVAVLAGVGQVSLLNTFCHFHTPLYVSLIRTAHGIWVGALVGVVAVLVWRAVADRRPRAAGP